MKARGSMISVAIVGLFARGVIYAGATPAGQSGSASDAYRYVVAVGCAPPNGQTVAYVWHTGTVAEPEFDRIFKEQAVGDFEDCLSEIARTKSGLHERLANLGPDSGQDVTREAMQEATEAWSQFGVYEAIREVATTGTRGPKVKAVLHACDDLKVTRESTAERK
jgi:hypothetical protein